jgi:OFA family oxalate/formate antiporter-like MFS transporter
VTETIVEGGLTAQRTVQKPPNELRRGLGPLIGAVSFYAGSPIILLQTGSVFVKPIMDDTGLPATAVTIGPVITLTLALLQPAVGLLLRRYSPRPMAIITLMGMALALIGLATLPPSFASFWGIAIFAGVVGSLGYWASLSRYLSLWFRRNFGIAIGLVGGSASLLPLIAIPIMSHFIYNGGGWRAGYWVLFVFVVAIALPLVLVLFRTPKEPIFEDDAALDGEGEGSGTEDSAGLPLNVIFRDGRYWTIVVSFALVTIGAGGFITNIAPIVLDREFSPAVATGLAMAILVGVMSGRILGGLMLDRIWPYAAPMIVFSVSGIGGILLVTLPVDTPVAIMWLVVIGIGLAQGAEGDFSSFFMLREFGSRHFPFINGWAILVMSVGLFIGGFSVAIFRDITGSYVGVAIVTALFYFAGAAMTLVAGYLSVRARRRGGRVFAGKESEV